MRERRYRPYKKRCRQTDGTLLSHLLTVSLPFLPSVLLHAEPAIPETPAGPLHFRSRRGCQAGCTGQCAQVRVVEYRNCWCASFCGPSWFFPPVRYEIVKVQLWTDGLLLTAWLPSQETENAGACQAGGLMGVCISSVRIISHWQSMSIEGR